VEASEAVSQRGKAIKVLVVTGDSEEAQSTREMLSNTQVSSFRITLVDSLLAALNLLATDYFDVALVDLTLPDAHGLEALGAIQRRAPGLPVILQTVRGGESQALKAIEHGAQDLLIKGVVTSDALVRVLTHAVARTRTNADHGKTDAREGIVTGVMGAKGGVGTTTVAYFHALELARQTKGKTLIMNLDTCGVGAAFPLHTSSEYSLLDAALNLHRLDTEFWAGLVAKVDDSVDLLQSPGSQSFAQTLEGSRIRHVLWFARGCYERIVVDLGRLDAAALAVIEDLKELFLVTSVDVPALVEASRVLRKLVDLGLTQNQLHLVLNKMGKRVFSSSARDIEKAIGYPVFVSLGDHSVEFAESLADGRLLSPDLELRREIGALTARSLGVTQSPPAPVRRGWLRLARA
jgi:Flp pilus assembly CpaE family ATPase